ncbi:unnamed protein product [Peniophora sp. CBMAI 1063]|nr:unnamed protein product [Peniophora sp. CBMAI 1063]
MLNTECRYEYRDETGSGICPADLLALPTPSLIGTIHAVPVSLASHHHHLSSFSSHTDLSIMQRLHELPADIVSDIYSMAALIDSPTNKLAYPLQGMSVAGRRKKPETTVVSLGWITLTHICRYWRHVGLDMAPLWAGVICVFPAAFEVLVTRTRGAPLSFDFRFAGSELRRDYAVEHLNNVQSIVDFGRSNGIFWAEQLAGHSLPRLKKLELLLDDTGEWSSLEVKDQEALHAPALQHLTLSHGLFFPFISPSLTGLALSASDFRPTKGLTTISELLYLLQSMPLLSNLRLDHILAFAAPDEAQGSDDSVDLPCLTSLYYAGHEDQFIALWKRLKVPLDLSLSVRLRKPRKNNMNSIIRTLSQHFHNPHFDTVFMSDIDYWQNETELTLTSGASDAPRVSIQSYHVNGIDDSKPEHVSSLLKRIRPHLNSAESMRHFRFRGAFRYEQNSTPQSLARVIDPLRHFTAVSQVNIEQMDAMLLSAVGNGEAGYLFPTLHTLSMTFAREEWGWTSSTLRGIWGTLLAALEARSEGGYQVTCLLLVGSRPAEQALAQDDEKWKAKAGVHVKDVLDERVYQ